MTEAGDDDISRGFSEWYPLSAAGVEEHAPDAPAAVQLATAQPPHAQLPHAQLPHAQVPHAQLPHAIRRLVPYPKGKSAMVFYFYAARSSREALKRLFAEEIETPGARGQGALVFRVLPGGDAARLHLERLYFEFEERFGSPPVLHAPTGDEASPEDETEAG